MYAVRALPVAENKVRPGKAKQKHWGVNGTEKLRAAIRTGEVQFRLNKASCRRRQHLDWALKECVECGQTLKWDCLYIRVLFPGTTVVKEQKDEYLKTTKMTLVSSDSGDQKGHRGHWVHSPSSRVGLMLMSHLCITWVQCEDYQEACLLVMAQFGWAGTCHRPCWWGSPH